MASNRMSGNLEFLLLEVLSRGPSHGYEVIQALAARSGGAFDLPEGSVYPALHRLERTGDVRSDWQMSSGRRRRYYALTDAGRQRLAAERAEWQQFSKGVNLVLGLA
jgi:transcriptional regulator